MAQVLKSKSIESISHVLSSNSLLQRKHLKYGKPVIKPVSNDTRAITSNVVLASALLIRTNLAYKPKAYPEFSHTSMMERFAKTSSVVYCYKTLHVRCLC